MPPQREKNRVEGFPVNIYRAPECFTRHQCEYTCVYVLARVSSSGKSVFCRRKIHTRGQSREPSQARTRVIPIYSHNEVPSDRFRSVFLSIPVNIYIIRVLQTIYSSSSSTTTTTTTTTTATIIVIIILLCGCGFFVAFGRADNVDRSRVRLKK